MLMPDVNVLVYAHREDEPAHEAYAEWLRRLVDGPGPFALSVLVAVGFLRIVTNPKIYGQPATLQEAAAFIDELTAQPRCRVTFPGPTHLDDTIRLCRLLGATGSAVADAQHAALAIAEGATWVTRDDGFARFVPHGLRWEHLLLE